MPGRGDLRARGFEEVRRDDALPIRPVHRAYSRFAASSVNAGRHTATYSAPPSNGEP